MSEWKDMESNLKFEYDEKDLEEGVIFVSKASSKPKSEDDGLGKQIEAMEALIEAINPGKGEFEWEVSASDREQIEKNEPKHKTGEILDGSSFGGPPSEIIPSQKTKFGDDVTTMKEFRSNIENNKWNYLANVSGRILVSDKFPPLRAGNQIEITVQVLDMIDRDEDGAFSFYVRKGLIVGKSSPSSSESLSPTVEGEEKETALDKEFVVKTQTLIFTLESMAVKKSPDFYNSYLKRAGNMSAKVKIIELTSLVFS